MFLNLLILVLLVLVVCWAYLTFGVPGLVLLAALVGLVAYLMFKNEPEGRIRHIHKKAEQDVFKSSQSYLDQVRRTLRR